MKIEIFACFLFIGVALATPVEPDFKRSAMVLQYAAENFDGMTPFQKIETINEFVDMALIEMGYLLIVTKMDPLSLPDVTQKFTGGTLTMNNGSLEGVSKIYRNGDVILDYNDRILKTDVSLTFENFQLDYDYAVKVWGLGTNGTINGTVKDINLNFKIDVDFKNLHITLVNFGISEINNISIKFEGGVIGSIINIISGLVTGIFKGMITDLLSNTVGDTLAKVIDEINKILEGIKNPPPPQPMMFNKFIFRNLA